MTSFLINPQPITKWSFPPIEIQQQVSTATAPPTFQKTVFTADVAMETAVQNSLGGRCHGNRTTCHLIVDYPLHVKPIAVSTVTIMAGYLGNMPVQSGHQRGRQALPVHQSHQRRRVAAPPALVHTQLHLQKQKHAIIQRAFLHESFDVLQ